MFIHLPGLTKDAILDGHLERDGVKLGWIEIKRAPTPTESIESFLGNFREIYFRMGAQVATNVGVVAMHHVGIVLRDSAGVRLNPNDCVDLFGFADGRIFAVASRNDSVVAQLRYDIGGLMRA